MRAEQTTSSGLSDNKSLQRDSRSTQGSLLLKRRQVLFITAVLIGLTGDAGAADADPAGTWKWSVTNPKDNQTRESTAKLKLDGGKLTGTITGPNGKDVNIEDGIYKDGQIVFSVTREGKKGKLSTKFSGKLDADTITGKFENERPNGQSQSHDWVAKREKA